MSEAGTTSPAISITSTSRAWPAFIANPPGYDGVVSGPVQAQGDLNNTAALTARAALAIAPGTRGVPVSGRLNVDYNGHADTVMLGRSYLQLPHTRVDLSGALGKQIDVRLVSRNLSDFRPLGNIPVTLHNGGAATVNATVTGSLSNPRISAHAALNNFAGGGRSFASFAAEVNANRGGATLSNGAHPWRALPGELLRQRGAAQLEARKLRASSR